MNEALDFQERHYSTPPPARDDETDFASASRRSRQEAVQAINASCEAAASIHWRLALLFTARAVSALHADREESRQRAER
jgi:hypothetical protein